jgi:4-amino-4-deoxy-L-arabinose transferase-like glycosyltransferase
MTDSTRTQQHTRWISLVIILLISFALRVGRIDQQSIWYDEGLSILYARGNWDEILWDVSESDHPPLHPLLLHAWMAVCGDSELSVRLLSAWWGIVAVALFYRLGSRLSHPTGTLAALLLAVSPFAVWYSQETRGYTMALALTISAADVALHLIQRPTRLWRYAVYVALATSAVYTHFFSGFVLLALNVFYLLWHGQSLIHTRHIRRQIIHWLIAQVVVLVLLAPWVPFVTAQWQINATHWHGGVGWRQIVRRTLTAFSVGQTLNDPWGTAATWTLSVLAAVGTVVLAWRKSTRPYAVLSWLWMAIPLLIVIAINRSRPKFSPRYLMNALPPFLLLASVGVRQLFRLVRGHAQTWRGWVAFSVLAVVTGTLGGATTRSLANHYLDEQLYRPDFRAVAQYIETHAAPNDLIVLVGGHSYPAFTYYYHGLLPIVPLPDKLLPTTQQPIDLSALATLNQAIQGRQSLWLVLWQDPLADPTGLIMDTIEQTYHRLGVGSEFHGLALLAFDVSPGPLLAESTSPQMPMVANLGHEIRFLGYDLPVDTAQPGDTLYLYLYWEALPQVTADYKVFTQILDESDQIVAQQDKVAGAEAYPTSHWPAGAIVRDRFLLTIHPEASAGQYRLITGLYKPGGSHPRLPVEGAGAQGDHILLSMITIRQE